MRCLGGVCRMMTFPADDGAGPSDEADDGTTVVTSTTSTMLTLSLEGSFKLHVRFTVLSREAASSRTPAVAATAEPMPPASALKAVMKQACERFCLLHGPLSALLPPPSPGADAADNERQRRRLQSSVERYWSEWIEHFAGRAPALLASSHGLALPSSSIAPPAVSAALDPPFALLSHSAITHSPSAQLPTELLHHLLTFVPRPPGEESAPPPVNGAADKAVGKDGPPSSWWDGLGSGLPSMSSMTLGLGRSNGAPAASSSAGPAMPERKSAFPASSLWKKATVDLLSLTSSPSTPPSPTRLPPREEEPKLPADVPLPPSTAASSSASVDELAPTVAGRVDEVTLKEAMEQALPDPEPVTLRWTQLELWLREGDVRAKTAVAFTLVRVPSLNLCRSLPPLTFARARIPRRSSLTRRVRSWRTSSLCTFRPRRLSILRSRRSSPRSARPISRPPPSRGCPPTASIPEAPSTTAPLRPRRPSLRSRARRRPSRSSRPSRRPLARRRSPVRRDTCPCLRS